MKKVIHIFLFGLFILTSISCNDEVNPKSEFKEIYALNCIIRGDTTFQIATISKSYNVDGYDPGTNTEDPFIKGAKIKINFKYGNKVYNFRDTLIARNPEEKYKTPLPAYYVKDFMPYTNSKMTIEAILPNGKILTAESETFYLSNYIISSNASAIPSDTQKGYLTFTWASLSTTGNSENIYYVPELAINYSRIEAGKRAKYQKKVPLFYLGSSGNTIPYYPSIQANTTTVSFSEAIIDQSMAELSESDPLKENYIIENAVFRLMVLDKNLASYYASQKTFKDEFSVRVTQPEFTNIRGGLGVFGSYNSAQIIIQINADYIRRYGYKDQ